MFEDSKRSRQAAKWIIGIVSICALIILGLHHIVSILGTLCMIGMAILRIPYAPMIGTLVGVTALIPVVGAFIGTIVGAIMILTVSTFKSFVFMVFLLILQQIEGNVIYPKVVGSKINLLAIWVWRQSQSVETLPDRLGCSLECLQYQHVMRF